MQGRRQVVFVWSFAFLFFQSTFLFLHFCFSSPYFCCFCFFFFFFSSPHFCCYFVVVGFVFVFCLFSFFPVHILLVFFRKCSVLYIYIIHVCCRLDHEYVARGYFFHKGRMKVMVSKIYRVSYLTFCCIFYEKEKEKKGWQIAFWNKIETWKGSKRTFILIRQYVCTFLVKALFSSNR